MSEKCTFISTSAIQVKNQGKTISTEEKLDTVSRLEKGEQIVDMYHKVRFICSSIHIMHNNADRITQSAKSQTKVFV
jgi:hypothetical protein